MYGVFVSGMIMLVMFYFVAIFMTIVINLPPDQAGVQLLYFAPGMGGGSLISIVFIRHFRQPKFPIVFSGIVSTVALGLISMAMEQNKQNLVKGFMAMAGVGVGLGMGPLAVHARFSQPEERVAIVSALSLFFRALGGTVGLAQCGAVLNGKVRAFLTDIITSGAISASDAQAISSTTSSSDLGSVDSIDSLSPELQSLVRDAFRDASRWCFISLIPWAAVAVITSLFLSNIKDRTGLPDGKVDKEATPVEVLTEENRKTEMQGPASNKLQ
ncbi:hypothetical protein QCA50_004386 [Cerrena zonata]|uniref:Major facilitator superfamily (MFS) profile domain-containing protein n=1 Tax=Cerrena zonata TaxID=2478898 RepID=A0AAW0GH53_9APHY